MDGNAVSLLSLESSEMSTWNCNGDDVDEMSFGITGRICSMASMVYGKGTHPTH